MSWGGGGDSHSHNSNSPEKRNDIVSKDSGVAMNIDGIDYTVVFLGSVKYNVVICGETEYYRRASQLIQPQIRYKCSDDNTVTQDWTNVGDSYTEWI